MLTVPLILESPGLIPWLVFFLYAILLVVGLYYLSRTFVQYRIVYGHLDDLFRFLTSLRIWSIRYRKSYTIAVVLVLTGIFLGLVYAAEMLHVTFYGTDPVFSGPVDYFRWLSVFVISGLQMGEYPRSLLAFVLSGVFPLFVIGSVLSIVRLTSEGAHEALVTRMAEGEISPYRVVILNYQEEYDEFVRSVLSHSTAFVVLFAKDDHIQDARSFVEGIERTDEREYRTHIEHLSYSSDVLFEQYSVLQSDELYIFPDAESRTDYENLRLITRLNEEVKDREQSPYRSAEPPNVIWMTDSRKLSGVAKNLEPTTFKENLHAMSFQDDVRDLVRANTNETITELEQYYNFSDEEVPPWIEGYPLENYTFRLNPLTEEELDALDEIKDYRVRTGSNSVESVQQGQLAAMRDRVLNSIRDRLQTERATNPPDRVGLFFGLLTENANASIPIDLHSAYLSQQMETTTDAIQVRKTENVSAPDDRRSSGGNIFIVNYNSKIKDFALSFEDYESSSERYLTMYTSENQITPDSTSRTNFVEYRSMNDLLDMLFNETERSPHRVSPGDTIILLLDYTIPSPKINVLRVLDAIDDKLNADSTDVDHNEVFLAVESDLESGNEEYRYLAVDKILETQLTQRLFLHNLVQMRTSDVVTNLIQEGKITREEAFGWAVNTAYYFREFRIDSCKDPKTGDREDEPVTGPITDIVGEWQDNSQRNPLPFTTFSLHRDEEHGISVELHELRRDLEVTENQFLVSFPRM